ncbi:MAG TPA: hypothetical protein VFG95_06510 [Nitrospiria bacterium]|nr:hypothetical protein [Nitrospiria bacterium]
MDLVFPAVDSESASAFDLDTPHGPFPKGTPVRPKATNTTLRIHGDGWYILKQGYPENLVGAGLCDPQKRDHEQKGYNP